MQARLNRLKMLTDIARPGWTHTHYDPFDALPYHMHEMEISPKLKPFPLELKLELLNDLIWAMGQKASREIQVNVAMLTITLLEQVAVVEKSIVRVVLDAAKRHRTYREQLNYYRFLKILRRQKDVTFSEAALRTLFSAIQSDVFPTKPTAGAVEGAETFVQLKQIFGLLPQDISVPDAVANLLFSQDVWLNIAEEAVHETAALDAWVAGWGKVVAKIHAGAFDFGASDINAPSEALRALMIKEPPYKREYERAVEILESARHKADALDEELWEPMELPGYNAKHNIVRGIERTFDESWLADLRRGVQQWRKLGPQVHWSGPKVPYASSLLSVDIGGTSLGMFLWSERKAKPSRQWREQCARYATSKDGALMRQSLLEWLKKLAPCPSPSLRIKYWIKACRFEAYRKFAVSQLQIFENADDAAHANFFNHFGPRQIHWEGAGDFGSLENDPAILSEGAVILARNAVAALTNWNDAETIAVLRDVGLGVLTKVSSASTNIGYRSLTVGNGVIAALGELATPLAIDALGHIKLKIRDERLVKTIATAMASASQRTGMSAAELEEMSAPTFHLDSVGYQRVSLGSCSAVLNISSTTNVAVDLLSAEGNTLKTIPASIRNDKDALAALKNLKAKAKEIEKTLAVQLRRIEASWFSKRLTPFEAWCERTLNHPLVGSIARRLIWRIEHKDGVQDVIWLAGKLVDVTGAQLVINTTHAQVRLWHPLEASRSDIDLWRQFMMDHRIVQPFRQAHREMYILTDAERETRVYSNRFAGHILRQHQSVTLARLRGWRATMRISADRPNDEPTQKYIPDFGIALEYWTRPPADDDAEILESQAYVYVHTDRVLFRRLEIHDGKMIAADEVPLEEISPIIFSEAMREIDLFVGVASIGNDPEWLDRGANAVHPNQWRDRIANEYWRNHSAAELDVSAKARREFLETLVPSLEIAGQCTFDDRNLIVQGKRNRYYIHLGSGNILINGDRYLCIVPRQSPDIFLPFEGDRMTSIILAKAVMLAHDLAIKDPGILNQL